MGSKQCLDPTSSDYATRHDTDDGTMGSVKDEVDEEQERLAEKETKAVHFSKTIVLLVLVISCAAAAALTFVFTRKGQEDDFSAEVRTKGAFQ